MPQSTRLCLSWALLASGARGEWSLHPSRNCFDGHGAVSIEGANPLPGVLILDDCKARCQEQGDCNGIVVQKNADKGVCYLRRQLQPQGCVETGQYDAWELAGLPRETMDLGHSGEPRHASVIGHGMGETEVLPVLPLPLSISADPPRSVFGNGEAGYNTYRIPALLRTPRGTLLAFAEGRSSMSDSGRIDVVMRRSADGGSTWGEVEVVASGDGNVARGNPSPVFDEETGKLILIWSYNNKYVFSQSSDDEGHTWSSPKNITAMVKRPGWGWMATGPGHAIQLKKGDRKGRLVVPFNTFFADAMVSTIVHQRGCANTDECAHYYDPSERSLDVMVEITNPADPTMQTLRSRWYNDTTKVPPFVWNGDRAGVFFSDDHGDSWNLGGMVDSRLGSSECMAAETGRGLLLSFRVEDGDTGCRKMALSQDDGKSFEPFFEPEVCIPEPVCQGSLLATTDGRVLSFGPGSSGARSDMTLHIASAEGSRRSPLAEAFPFRKLGMVNKGGGGYSDIVQVDEAEPPRIGMVWELGFEGGVVFSAARLPGFDETDFEDPQDPWGALV